LGLAEQVTKNAPLSVSASKQLIKAAVDMPEEQFWELQNTLMGPVFGSNDAKEGPKAFAEKRPPKWTGT